MVFERDTYLDADDTTVSVTQSLLDAQAPSHDDGDAHEDGRAVLREAVQVTSHGRVVSCAVRACCWMAWISSMAQSIVSAILACISAGSSPSTKRGSHPQPRKNISSSSWLMRELSLIHI